MKELLIIICLALFIVDYSEAKPSVVPQIPVEPDTSVNIEEHVRVRRQNFDYEDYMEKFWSNVDNCTNCNTLNIGNGYKNKNTIYFGEKQNKENRRTTGKNIFNIGNGSKNKNTVFIGHFPGAPAEGSMNSDFWND